MTNLALISTQTEDASELITEYHYQLELLESDQYWIKQCLTPTQWKKMQNGTDVNKTIRSKSKRLEWDRYIDRIKRRHKVLADCVAGLGFTPGKSNDWKDCSTVHHSESLSLRTLRSNMDNYNTKISKQADDRSYRNDRVK